MYAKLERLWIIGENYVCQSDEFFLIKLNDMTALSTLKISSRTEREKKFDDRPK